MGPGDTVKAVDLNLHQAHLVVFRPVVTATETNIDGWGQNYGACCRHGTSFMSFAV